MTSRRRWLIVAIGVLLLAVTPYAVSRLPVGRSNIPADTLLARINASADVPYSGYAEADGGLALPDAAQFGSVVDLLGGRTDLRIWSRAPKDWRVDAVALTGETDVHQDAAGIWTWDYESNQATRADYLIAPEARLPRADDLAPASLARRLLVQADPGEISRLPDRRIAGHDAAGLRLRPAETASTIARVDVWALPASGLPVRVEVYGKSGGAALSTAMLDVSTAKPAPSDTAFTPPGQAQVRNDDITDIVSAVSQFVQARPPDRLAGLTRTTGSTAGAGSVGVYGRGVTTLIAVPLPPRLADSIDEQLSASTDVGGTGDADVIAFGPLELRLTARAENGTRWLLAGTVTAATLARAETQLPVVADFFR